MEHFILKTKKFICLMLSLCLLFANTSVFAQSKGEIKLSVPKAADKAKIAELQGKLETLSQKITNAENSFTKLIENFKKAPYYMEYVLLDDGDHGLASAEVRNNWYKTINNGKSEYYKGFRTFQQEMNKFFDEFTAVSEEINYAYKYAEEEVSKEVLERLSYKYTGQSPQVYPKKLSLMDEAIVKHYRNVINSSVPSDFIKKGKNLQDMYTVFKVKVNIESKNKLAKVTQDVLKVDRGAERIILHKLKTPEEVLRYAYERLYTDAQKYGIKITLRSTREEATLFSTIRDIQRYIRFFGTTSTERVSFFRLFRTLISMKDKQRTEYIKQLIGLSKEEKKFLTDLSKLERSEKFVKRTILYSPDNFKVTGKVIKGLASAGVLVGIGALLTVANITQVSAQNNFSDSVNIADLEMAIEDGTSTPDEDLIYYTYNRAAEDQIAQDFYHATKFIETAEIILDTNILAQEMIQEQEQRAEIDQLIKEMMENMEEIELNLA